MLTCGLIGGSLPHSYSKIIHDMISGGEYSYDLMPMPEDEVGKTLAAGRFRGLNVTIPYKRTVIPFCSALSPEAARIGSVNTITNDGGRLTGYNTDYAGFKYMADAAGIGFGGKKVLILGSGGTSLTARAVASDAGAREIVVATRGGGDFGGKPGGTNDNSGGFDGISGKTPVKAVGYADLPLHYDSEVLINTTPVGMFPDNGSQPAALGGFTRLAGVIDVIYNPLRTRLLLEARERGITHTGGLPMLVAQAVEAAALFLGKPPDEKVTAETLRAVGRRVMNIVLTGMSGSGKSAAGRLAAKRLGMRFVDTDEVIAARAGMDVPEIFAKHGEGHFRRLEAEIAAGLRCEAGVVIATGGGMPVDRENYLNLAQNGRLYLLRRPVGELDLTGRPLCPDAAAAERLYRERLPVYLARADVVLDNAGKIDDVVEGIVKDFLA